jgi:hypothetical protein
MPLSDYHTEEPPRQKDLLRRTVHLLLTVYLLPAICLVILVGLMVIASLPLGPLGVPVSIASLPRTISSREMIIL